MTASWRATVLTLFPEVFPGPLGASLAGRGLRDGLWRLDALDMRAFGIGRHRSVDDTPFGGGAGMVLPDLTIACGEGAVRLLEVQRAGKSAARAADFLRGLQHPLARVS